MRARIGVQDLAEKPLRRFGTRTRRESKVKSQVSGQSHFDFSKDHVAVLGRVEDRGETPSSHLQLPNPEICKTSRDSLQLRGRRQSLLERMDAPNAWLEAYPAGAVSRY